LRIYSGDHLVADAQVLETPHTVGPPSPRRRTRTLPNQILNGHHSLLQADARVTGFNRNGHYPEVPPRVEYSLTPLALTPAVSTAGADPLPVPKEE
jgi:hypothetical protein